MRSTLLVLAAFGLPTFAQAPDENTEAERAKESVVATRKAAEAFRVTVGEAGSGSGPLKLEPKSVLQWSNPVSGSFHGSVFVWTEKGRPGVVASIYKKYLPLPHHLGVEFHSLVEGSAKAERDGQAEWSPTKGGVEFKAITDAEAPGKTPAQRLRQLRALAGDFSATKTTREAVTRPLRLLTQPIYRYESTDPAVIDGALFAFVEGNDPEVFLLIEARSGAKGPTWHYALARMNSIEFHASRKGQEVWSKEILPWPVARSASEPYTLLIFPPGEGVNPAEER